jgi:hypothetical protein
MLCNPRAATHASMNVAANVPRASLLTIEAAFSSMPAADDTEIGRSGPASNYGKIPQLDKKRLHFSVLHGSRHDANDAAQAEVHEAAWEAMNEEPDF